MISSRPSSWQPFSSPSSFWLILPYAYCPRDWDKDARRAWHGDTELDLTTKEFDLLWILLRDAGKVVTREQIMREVWDAKWWTSTKTLDMHISWLRRKLGDDAHSPRYITTVRGVGFRFERGD